MSSEMLTEILTGILPAGSYTDALSVLESMGDSVQAAQFRNLILRSLDLTRIHDPGNTNEAAVSLGEKWIPCQCWSDYPH